MLGTSLTSPPTTHSSSLQLPWPPCCSSPTSGPCWNVLPLDTHTIHSLLPFRALLTCLPFRKAFSNHPAERATHWPPEFPTPYLLYFLPCPLSPSAVLNINCFVYSLLPPLKYNFHGGRDFVLLNLPLGQYCLRAEIQPVDTTSLRGHTSFQWGLSKANI